MSLADILLRGTRLLANREGSPRIAITGSATTGMIARAVAVAASEEGAAEEGASPVIYEAPFGAWRQEALDPNSALHRFAPDITLLATDFADFDPHLPLDADTATAAAAVTKAVAGLRAVWDALPGRIIQHLPAAPAWHLAGIAERRLPASPRRFATALAEALLEAGPDIVFLDTEGLARDDDAWFAACLPFAQSALPDYATRFRAAFRTATGRAKKLLALDLDNTLWGGVIGDDEGIELGPDTPRGAAHAAFQAYLKALGARGVILAVCSKNDPAIAAAGLAHPNSALARENFAAFDCSWEDKPAGLRRIAAGLGLGLDAMVFADDNPAECALVAESLPEVAVVTLGEEPADFIARLEAGRWFESQMLGAGDFSRATAYQARAAAEVVRGSAADLAGFLAGLEMRGRILLPPGLDLARIAQLEARTNQFNLTTRRYGEAAITAFAARPDALVLGATLADKFGDHGLVSGLIATEQGDALAIESWVMSCRVFSRTLEQFVLRAVLAEAARRGLARVVGFYTPTAKNGVVGDLYARLGFAPAGEGQWVLATAFVHAALRTHVVAAS